MGEQLTLVVCRHLERETRAVLEAEGWRDVRLAVCPPVCLRRAEGEPAAEPRDGAATGGTNARRVVGCGRLKTKLALPSDPVDSVRAAMSDCFEWVVGREQVQGWIREGSFLLTPGWLADWREHLRQWGFDRDQAAEFFAESTRCLLLLDTGVDSSSWAHLAEFSAFVGRPGQAIAVGLDHYRLQLERVVLRWREEQRAASHAAELGEAQRRLADYAMLYDLMGNVTGAATEAEVIARILELLTLLFSPEVLIYLPVVDGQAGTPYFFPTPPMGNSSAVDGLAELREDFAWSPGEPSFQLRIGQPDQKVGVVSVRNVAFPQYTRHYLNLGRSVAQVCGLAVSNARTYERLHATADRLREAMVNVRTLSGIIPICAACKKIRDDEGYWSRVESYVQRYTLAKFSHGLCPECMPKYFPNSQQGTPE